jgi:hypothetical protein
MHGRNTITTTFVCLHVATDLVITAPLTPSPFLLPSLAPARRLVAACEPAIPRAVPRAFPRRRALSPLMPLPRLPSPPLGAASQLVSRPRRAPCLVRFLVAAPYRTAAHAVPPPPPLAPARRRVAASEPAAPCAVPRAFPRRRAVSHRRSRCPSSASARPRSAPRPRWCVDRAARRASCVSSSPRHIAQPLTLSLLRIPLPPLGAASQQVSLPRRAPCLLRFLVAAPYRIAPHAAPPPPSSPPLGAACESAAPRAVPSASPRRRAISHRTSHCPSSASPRPRSAPRRS